MSNLRKAATAVLIRDGESGPEALLVKRSSHGFFGKLWVFPGGSVDEADLDQAAHELEAAQICAARETLEEAGVNLESNDLLPFAHWTPPENLPTRFATWFFISDDVAGQQVNIDDHEIVEFMWIDGARAIELHGQGKLPMAPPTVVTLTELAQLNSCAEVMAYYKERGISHYLPKIGHKEGKNLLMLYNGDAGYDDCDPAKEGHRNRIHVESGICRLESDFLPGGAYTP